MASAREIILRRVRDSLGGPPDAAAVDARIAAHTPGLVPQRGLVSGSDAVEAFRTRMNANFATIVRVDAMHDVPGAVSAYLARETISGPVRLAPDARLTGLSWPGALVQRSGIASEDDAVGVSIALVGIAETGTLLLASGPEAPSSLNFLPETHIVVLTESDIVGALEDAWRELRRAHNGQMPRTVNLISGPSRTADIAMTMFMGAHGPKRLHVILIGNHDQAA